MALHVYQTWIEHNDNPGYHPISVYVKQGSGNQAIEVAEFHGKSLVSLIRKAAKRIAELEIEQTA